MRVPLTIARVKTALLKQPEDFSPGTFAQIDFTVSLTSKTVLDKHLYRIFRNIPLGFLK